MESIVVQVHSVKPPNPMCHFTAAPQDESGEIELILTDRLHGQLEILANKGWDLTLTGEFISQKFSDYLRKFRVESVCLVEGDLCIMIPFGKANPTEPVNGKKQFVSNIAPPEVELAHPPITQE